MEEAEYVDIQKYKTLEAKLRNYKIKNKELTDKKSKLNVTLQAMEAEIAKLNKILELLRMDYHNEVE